MNLKQRTQSYAFWPVKFYQPVVNDDFQITIYGQQVLNIELVLARSRRLDPNKEFKKAIVNQPDWNIEPEITSSKN